MARSKTTETTTRSSGGKNEAINEVASEIHSVRDEVEREVEALEKVRGMLDVDYLRRLVDQIESLESRIKGMEAASADGSLSAMSLQENLEQEQERLAKLWDAYKAQEDELQRVRRDYPLMEEKLFERERTIQKLRREMAELKSFAKYKTEYQALLQENNRLQQDVEDMKALKLEKRRMENKVEKAESELERNKAAMREMERELDGLRARGVDMTRVEELEALLDEEQERLAKLYAVYEDMENDNADLAKKNQELQTRLDKWEDWFAHMPDSVAAAARAYKTKSG